MPHFGFIDALQRTVAPLAAELRELLEGITVEQRRTNELLEQLVRGQKAKPATRNVPAVQK